MDGVIGVWLALRRLADVHAVCATHVFAQYLTQPDIEHVDQCGQRMPLGARILERSCEDDLRLALRLGTAPNGFLHHAGWWSQAHVAALFDTSASRKGGEVLQDERLERIDGEVAHEGKCE